MPTMSVKQGLPRLRAAAPATCICVALLLGACTMSETEQRVGSGAALGALGGSLLGGSREGAAIGAAIGAAGGFIVDQQAKRSDAESENARLRAENERLRQEAASQ